MCRWKDSAVAGILISPVILLGVALACQAEQRGVPGRYPTVQAAIDAAADGDEVVLAAGTYTGSGNCDLNFKGKTVLVRSSNPQDPAMVAATVLDCMGSASSPHRAATLNCQSDEREAGLAGLTITGAYDPDGAVVCDIYGSPVIRNCIVRGNTGSGIYVNPYGSPTISDCRIESNVVGEDGGGICLALQTHATIERCIIRGNNAANGGGLYVYDSWPDVYDCQISGNYATDGGAVYWHDSGLVMDNCTIAGNSGQLGAMYGMARNYTDVSSLTNCIVWGNHAADARQITLAVDPFGPTPDTLAISYSLIQGGQEGIAIASPWSVDWGSGNLSASADPGFVAATGPDGKWATWQDNDYRLSSHSICIDAGDPTGDYAGLKDATGQPRLAGSRVDLGAYEAVTYTQTALVGDINGDNHVDMLDLLGLAVSFGKSKGTQDYNAACDFDGDGTISMADLVLLAGNFGK
jgi:parallel beta-helix repeat protein